MAFYRNYSSGMKILEHSEWTGPADVEALSKFLDGIKADGGQGCEAVEIGLLHANKEIYEPADKVPVSLIYVIGDAPGNANIDVVDKKKRWANSEKYFDNPQLMNNLTENLNWRDNEERTFG